MSMIFNLIYLMIMLALSPWIAWRFLFQHKNRRGWLQKLIGQAPVRDSSQPCVWIHAVSVGEVNLLSPLIAELNDRYPNLEIAISTTTETGFDLARRKYADHIVFFCPADFSWAVKNTLRRLQPSVLLLTELELWPNLISITRSKQIPVALINGRISEQSYLGYRRFRSLFSWVLNHLNLAIVQSTEYADRLELLGLNRNRIEICGNLKFDGLIGSSGSSTIGEFLEQAQLREEEFVLVAGSTQENEDRMAIEVYRRLKPTFPQLRLVLVPRHPDRAPRLTQFLTNHQLPFLFRSNGGAQVDDSPVMVIDVIGELQQWWSKADFGYVGGSMGGRGGQNMIEPASLGVPVCFGPNTENFKDVVDQMMLDQAAQIVCNVDEFESLLRLALVHDPSIAAMAQRGYRLVQTQTGSTKRTADLLAPVFEVVDVLCRRNQAA